MRHSLYLDRPNARFGLKKVKDKVINTLYNWYDRFFNDSNANKMLEIENQYYNPSTAVVEENPYDKYGYIGGDTREARQKYFNIDKELTDSVRSISNRYGIRPEVVASRLAEEGPIDHSIRRYNGIGEYKEDNDKGFLLSKATKMQGPLWGLDDIYTDLLKGNVQFTTQTPYDYYDMEFDNEKGRRTYSIESPQWWLGVEGNAAELKYHRDKFKQQFPNISDKDLDAAAAMSFNMGTIGAKNFYKENGYIPKRYYPYINVKRNGGRISLETL